MTSMNPRLEPMLFSCDAGQQKPCFDRCPLSITWMSNIIDVRCKGCIPKLTYELKSHHHVVGNQFVASYEYGILLGAPLAWSPNQWIKTINYKTVFFMPKQVHLPNISSILQKMKIDPKSDIDPLPQKPSIIIMYI